MRWMTLDVSRLRIELATVSLSSTDRLTALLDRGLLLLRVGVLVRATARTTAAVSCTAVAESICFGARMRFAEEERFVLDFFLPLVLRAVCNK